MTALYLIADQYRKDLELVMSADLDEQTFKDTMEAIGGDLEDKATNIAFAIRNEEATVAAMKAEEERMTTRRKAAAAKLERLRDYLKTHLEACGMTKIQAAAFTIAVQSNPASVIVDDESVITKKFFVKSPPPPPKLDKAALKAAIEAGQNVKGAHIEKGTRLVIK